MYNDAAHGGKAEDKKKGSFLLTLCIALAIALLLRFFVFSTIRVDGPSMQDTLFTGENIIIEKVTYLFSEPKRYDIVVCKFEKHRENYVKRIIGLPGETIEIRAGDIYINDIPLEGDTHAKGISGNSHPKILIPEGHYFVMGDNRTNSLDSVNLGTVIKKDIVGRGVAIVWPLNKIELLTD